MNLRSCMHACMYEVCSFKAPASDTSKGVRLSQKWDYDQLHSNYGKVLHLGCWYVMCVLVQKP